MKTVAAGEFKAQCLALLNAVAYEHEIIIVTKRGKPVAKVAPVSDTETDLRKQLKGSVLGEKDIISPVKAAWEANS